MGARFPPQAPFQTKARDIKMNVLMYVLEKSMSISLPPPKEGRKEGRRKSEDEPFSARARVHSYMPIGLSYEY